MIHDSEHLSDEQVVLTAQGELRAAAHLDECASCRQRVMQVQQLFGEFVAARRSEIEPRLPPIDRPRAALRRKLASAGGGASPARSAPIIALAGAAALAVLGVFALSERPAPQRTTAGQVQSRFAPDPGITPGLTKSLPLSELCGPDSSRAFSPVPRPVALEVFRLHGIEDPPPRAYELDHLIPPELGGASDIRNLWPQPYHAHPWNAYAKDALEDRLLHLVCDGRVTLVAAQRDLARDWIAAYKKYFGTDDPLLAHAGFLKDEPWQ